MEQGSQQVAAFPVKAAQACILDHSCLSRQGFEFFILGKTLKLFDSFGCQHVDHTVKKMSWSTRMMLKLTLGWSIDLVK